MTILIAGGGIGDLMPTEQLAQIAQKQTLMVLCYR
jgi:hypothetical protein